MNFENLVNKSSIPTEKLQKIIKFCLPAGLPLPRILVKTTKAHETPWSAEYYYERNLVITRFAENIKFPFRAADRKSCKGYIFKNYEFYSKTEMMVYIFAHEFQHLADFTDPKTRNLIYFDEQEAERRADTFALKRLLRYRKLKEQGNDPLK